MRVRTPQFDQLGKAIVAAGGTVTNGAVIGELSIQGRDAQRVGDIAYDGGVRLHELTVVGASLETAFMELTGDSVEYHAAVPGAPVASFTGGN